MSHNKKRKNISKKTKKKLIKLQKKRCLWCGLKFVGSHSSSNYRKKATVEHLNPLNNNGMDNRSNFAMVHYECNLGHKYDLGFALSLYMANVRFRPCITIGNTKKITIAPLRIFEVMKTNILVICNTKKRNKEYKIKIKNLEQFLLTEKENYKIYSVKYEDDIHNFITMLKSVDKIDLSKRPLIDSIKDYQNPDILVERGLVRRKLTCSST